MEHFTAMYEKITPHLIEDSLRASAYEGLSLEAKGKLKDSIARLYAYWGHEALSEERVRRYSGFSVHENTSPASCALICCCAKSLHGEGLIPALLPALMAGVEHVIPWFIVDSSSPVPDELLMALELLGIESAFASSYEEFATSLQSHIPLSSDDRLVFLGDCFESDILIASLLMKQGVRMLCFPQGKLVYPPLVPHWYCNTSIVFQS